jgi:hypothetical protein
MPQGTLSRMGDELGSLAPGIPQLWWVDPQRSQRLEQARRDTSVRLEAPQVEDRYWQELSKKEQSAPATTQK